MGFFRNLTAAEILDQLTAIGRELEKKLSHRDNFLCEGASITNVVFMGMGEPLANYDQVLKAIRLMTHPCGLNTSEQRVTVSTSGLAPRMRQFAREGLKCKLALSLNATTDEQRTRLMPINAKYSIDEILDAAREWATATQQPVTLEYVLIRDVNDSIADAKRLRKLMGRLPCKLNLIPFNEIEGSDFRRPELERIERFRRIVAESCYVAPIRFSKGRDIAAACGQLRTIYEKQGAMMRRTSTAER
jgi:23S rRNA (adenine2503-C2)-methyltransferase